MVFNKYFNKYKNLNSKMDNKRKIKGNLELRIIIVGDEKVGKKTLAKRIQMLNSSESKLIDYNIKLYNQEKEENRKKKYEKIIYRNKNLRNNEQNENLDFRDKQTIELTENELRKDKERKKIMSIQKIYKFNNFNTIKINVYPCIEIKEVNNNYSDEEKIGNLDEFEIKYNKSVKGLFNEIIQIISIPGETLNNKVEILFLFCFDLSNFNSFENILLYYNQLNQKFNVKNNYYMALIGNKNDKKKVMKEKEQRILENFINQVKINYYQISSLLYFKFETFFENLFFDIFVNDSKYNFNSIEFKEKFHIIISEKPNFTKSQRNLNPKNIRDYFPSPNKYNNNPFEYPLSKKTLINLFNPKNKYKKKIFIDKKGPLYPKLFNRKDVDKDNEIIKYRNLITKNNEVIVDSNFIDTKINNHLKNFLEPHFHIPGYSISGFHSDHSLSLRENRRKINFENAKEIKNAFDDGQNLRLNKKKLRKIKSYDKNNIIFLKKKREKLKNQRLLEERHYCMKLKNKSLENEKINKILEKEKIYDKKYLQKKEKIYKAKLNYFKKALQTTVSFKQKKTDYEPKAKFYDTISSISLNKGFSFGKKYKNKQINLISPNYPYFMDDFEKIVQKYKNKKEIKSYSERFPKYRTEETGDSRDIMEQKQKLFELKRKKLKCKAFSDFFDYMKRHKKAFILKKKQMEQKDEENYNNLINNKYFLTEIDYSQVETSYPKYSIAGKNNINKVYVDRNYNMEFFDEENKCKKFSITEEEKPNIGNVRPNFPKYSFGKEKRFKKTLSDIGKKEDKNLEFNNEENNKNWLFKKGIFGYIDKQSYLKTQTFMGLGKRMKDYKDNGVPGPGQYSIKGFADLITFKNDKKVKMVNTERNKSE